MATLTTGADAGVAKLVIAPALLWIGEHRVGLGGLLELLFGALVIGIPVGMVLERHLAIGALDLRLTGVLRYAEHVVVVALTHALATFTIAARRSRARSI